MKKPAKQTKPVRTSKAEMGKTLRKGPVNVSFDSLQDFMVLISHRSEDLDLVNNLRNVRGRSLVSDERRMLNIDELLKNLNLSRTTIFRMEKAGDFPRSHQLSPNKRFWYADEITKWKNTRNQPVDKKLLAAIKKKGAAKKRTKKRAKRFTERR